MKTIIGLFIAGVVFITSNSLFVVNEYETAVVFRLGEIVKSDLEPGLHLKTPFINNVRSFDKRIQILNSPTERYLTGELKNLDVDSFVNWRVSNAELFYTTVGGDYMLANQRLAQIIKDGLRSEFGSRTVQQVVSGERVEAARNIAQRTEKEAGSFGIEIVDIKIKRIDLPKEISDSVFSRMQAERSRVASDLRSLGNEAAERIRADADKQETVILANAEKDAEILRGTGDAVSADVYAQAYNKDREFYSFYQSLNSYKESFASKSDILVLDPQTDFFKHFGAKTK